MLVTKLYGIEPHHHYHQIVSCATEATAIMEKEAIYNLVT